MRMIGKFADTELASAMVNALFAAFVKSSLPVGGGQPGVHAAAGDDLCRQADRSLGKNPAMLNGVRIPVMPVGDEIQINGSTRTDHRRFRNSSRPSCSRSRQRSASPTSSCRWTGRW
jgi:capsid protein